MRPLRVLFLCTGNSCRSQLAEGWARTLGGANVEAQSAGVEAKGLHPLAVAAMAEVGVDLSRQRSKRLASLIDRDFAVVVTVCDRAKESCPVWPGARTYLHWSFDDPAEAQGSEEARLQLFRRVRDEIRERVSLFLCSRGIALAE